MNSFGRDQAVYVTQAWLVGEQYGPGETALAERVDVDGDGELELVCNVESKSKFVALNQDESEVWSSTQNSTQHKRAYSPQITASKLFYGDRSNDTVYAVNLADGSLAWSYTADGDLQALEQTDHGLLVGSEGTGGEVNLLAFADGSSRSGWPVSFAQNKQMLGAGDLDGDGQDEYVLSDSSGIIKVYNRDGSERFTITSGHGHVDLHTIGDIDPDRSGQSELLTVIDTDSSASGEGDELALYDADGTQLRKNRLVGRPTRVCNGRFRQ